MPAYIAPEDGLKPSQKRKFNGFGENGKRGYGQGFGGRGNIAEQAVLR
jgi:hypothetical protein